MVIDDYAEIAIGVLFMLLIVTVFTFALSKTRFLEIKTNGRTNTLNCSILMITFGLLGIIATYYFSIQYDTALVSVRDFPIVAAGFLGGPIVGLGAGLIAGIERFLEGGVTAIPCTIATILAGMTGGLVWYFSGKRFPKIWAAVITMFVVESVHMILVYTISDPVASGKEIAGAIALPMIISTVFCMMVFSYVYYANIRKNKS
jgi:phosphoserine phosphatase RsbU/P